MKIGTLFIISAPSGGGKTSIVSALCRSLDQLLVSISHTTRPIRPDEQDGVNYHFISETAFKDKISAGQFLEYANVFENWYGTSKAWVDSKLQAGQDVILEIDWQGAKLVMERMPATSIFILPPSKAILEARLRGRGTDSEAVILRRLEEASHEISHATQYDYWVVNQTLDQAIEDVAAIIRAQRLTQACRAPMLTPLISELTVNKN